MVLEKSKKNDTRLPSVATLPAPGVLAVVEQDRLAAFGDMSVENVVMPRLVIVQKMSPEVDDGSAKGGEFFIKGLGINMGTNPLEIIPVRRDVSKIRWNVVPRPGWAYRRWYTRRKLHRMPRNPLEWGRVPLLRPL